MGALGRLIVGLAMFAGLAAVARPEEIDLAPMPDQGALLLRNGNSISGKITRAGDVYYVALPHGELRIKAAEVEFCCRDLEEGYRRKRAAIRVGNVHDHLRLAQWCQRHGLWDHAARELADAQSADPRHPMIALLQRRLKAARQPPQKSSRPAKPARPFSGGSLQTTTDGKPPPPSTEDLDRLVRGLPAGSVEAFSQAIQPVLMNNCTVSGCHGPAAKSRYRLLRIPVDRPPTRLLTQRNLQATLQWVDLENPAASLLLTVPIHPHGTARPFGGGLFQTTTDGKPIFTHQTSAQYQRIVNWVFQVAQRPGPRVPATITPREKPPVRAMPEESTDLVFPLPQQPADRSAGPEPVVPRFPAGRGASPPRFVPRDPFDPEIFNRRYFP